jgi:hypothetical protein
MTMKRMWGTVALVTLVSLVSGLAHADEIGDLSGYDIRVTLDPITQTLVGSQQVDYFNDPDVDPDRSGDRRLRSAAGVPSAASSPGHADLLPR